ncbi:hypothetical protein QN391_24900 [Pseudomonas sp. CCI1.2]|uniref:hypothetical protein n=1 Tax=Pseudomonas sp. CCI4.2 TaxID=3048620 RepID=UPI002AC899B2|nr:MULTISPECIES: hypothetical protein [unclassified Pseudomonas]MEB0090455.1 hypothetical protein [Pseudomonas sp. CCI4.2]MEB0123897.1 hypothetical protein [Pseudomonas sp. CCI1.2]WPX55710.1 hypothetical protein RHM65_09210 [Pseudomonas sp. CCI4.2]
MPQDSSFHRPIRQVFIQSAADADDVLLDQLGGLLTIGGGAPTWLMHRIRNL